MVTLLTPPPMRIGTQPFGSDRRPDPDPQPTEIFGVALVIPAVALHRETESTRSVAPESMWWSTRRWCGIPSERRWPARFCVGRRLRSVAAVIAKPRRITCLTVLKAGLMGVPSAVTIASSGVGCWWADSDLDTVGKIDFDQPLAIPPLADSHLDGEGRRVFELTAQAGTAELRQASHPIPGDSTTPHHRPSPPAGKTPSLSDRATPARLVMRFTTERRPEG
jgi:hypothetical protein